MSDDPDEPCVVDRVRVLGEQDESNDWLEGLPNAGRDPYVLELMCDGSVRWVQG